MAKNTIAVMGATGHIGHVLTEELLKKGHKVRALGRDARKLQDLKAKGAETFSGDFTDSALLSRVFKGCNAIFSFTPPAMEADDIEVYRDRAGEAIAHAVAKANVTHVLNLSSMGASEPIGTGLIKELHRQEERLNAISNLHLLHFRPNYFMENLLQSLPAVRSSGAIVSALHANHAIPMVATHDIALKIADFMSSLKFSGTSIFEFVGPQAITMTEATKVIGKAIGKPDLKYAQHTYAQVEKELIASGMRHQLAKLMVEMQRAFNEEKVAPTQQLTADHKGKTTIEEFAKVFAQLYRSAKKAA